MIRLLFVFYCFLFLSCQKEITDEIMLDLPEAAEKIVIEGVIEAGSPAILNITKSVGFFSPSDSSSINKSIVRNAKVTVNDGSSTFNFRFIDTTIIFNCNRYPITGYYNLDLIGMVGKTYSLNVIVDDKTYTAITTIPSAVPLFDVHFRPQPTVDSLGFIWANFTEPVGPGHAYRWFAKRNTRVKTIVQNACTNLNDTVWAEKDNRHLPPLGSVFNDQFIDGTTFELGFPRGREPNSSKPDDNNEERGYFKKGDTVSVKFCTIDYSAFEFYRSFETDVANTGNPFAAPSLVKTNIKGGGLGVWCGQSASFHTVIAR